MKEEEKSQPEAAPMDDVAEESAEPSAAAAAPAPKSKAAAARGAKSKAGSAAAAPAAAEAEAAEPIPAPLPAAAAVPVPAAASAKSAAAAKSTAAASKSAPAAKAAPAAAAAAGKKKPAAAEPQVKSEEDEADEEEDADEDVDEDADADTKRWAASLPDYNPEIDNDSDLEDMSGSDSDDDGGDDDDDAEDGEADEAADAAADDDLEGLASSKPVRASKDNKDAESFGSALTSLLSKPLPQSVLDGRQAPVLVADRTLAARHNLGTNPLKAARRHALERKLARKYMLNRDHNPQPLSSPAEKKLMRVATKGVVTLFNAVAKQQKALREAQETAMGGQKEEEKKKGQWHTQLTHTRGGSLSLRVRAAPSTHRFACSVAPRFRLASLFFFPLRLDTPDMSVDSEMSVIKIR